MRVFAVSDLHVDYPENLAWAMDLDAGEYRADSLILAGDVTDDIELLARVLANLRQKFHRVFFVPGNHELWIERDDIECSLEKFDQVLQCCEELGVHTAPLHLEDVSIVPLFSWYDFSFGEPDRHLRRAWRDFRACRWPQSLPDNESINRHFLAMNETVLDTRNRTVISFSHFLPRIDVMPSAIPQKRRRVYPVLGSDSLGEQVARLAPDIHVYGHSHVNQDIFLGETRFINNAFAYPDETRISRKYLRCIFDDRQSCDQEISA